MADLAKLLGNHIRMTAAVEAACRYLDRLIKKNGTVRPSEALPFLERRYPDVDREAALPLIRERYAELARRGRRH